MLPSENEVRNKIEKGGPLSYEEFELAKNRNWFNQFPPHLQWQDLAILYYRDSKEEGYINTDPKFQSWKMNDSDKTKSEEKRTTDTPELKQIPLDKVNYKLLSRQKTTVKYEVKNSLLEFVNCTTYRQFKCGM
jgi:hypothetical protein